MKEPKIRSGYRSTWHNDGTLSWWSVYQQVWQRTDPTTIPASELAGLDYVTRGIIESTKEIYGKSKI